MRDNEKFILDPYLACLWSSLEEMLRFIIANVKNVANDQVLLPRDVSDLGYNKPHRTCEIAMHQAVASRNCFVIWIGALSYYMATYGLLLSSTIEESTVWKNMVLLVGEEGIVAKFSPENPRARTVLPMLNNNIEGMKTKIDSFLYWGVPVLIRWEESYEVLRPELGIYTPPLELTRAVKWGQRLRLGHHKPSALSVNKPRPAPLTLHTARDPSSVINLENAEPFYFALKRFHSEQQQDAMDDSLREQREKNVDMGIYDLTSKFFVWGCRESGEWVRVQVERGRVPYLMSVMGYAYDSVHNEWDLDFELVEPLGTTLKTIVEGSGPSRLPTYAPQQGQEWILETIPSPPSQMEQNSPVTSPNIQNAGDKQLVFVMAKLQSASIHPVELEWVMPKEYTKRLRKLTHEPALNDLEVRLLDIHSPLVENM
ncbi:hypothetical protein BDZ94DRAFT_1241194 [Collybia nuda]|uniref:Uncharacterized protein n=1 Tax=Collybia nuda TaxID=64659 RepID=A0A9P6C992_9AGAR|nr:hypothetical protein BDZ94DRAFT_1241194 [Collybia nuda]